MTSGQSIEPVSVSIGRGGGWLIDGLSFFSRDWLSWIGLAVLLIALTLVASAIPIANIIMPVLTPVFVGGLMLACREQDEGGEITVAALFSGFSSHAGQLALLGLVYLLSNIAILMLVIVLIFIILGGADAFSQLSTENPELVLEHAVNILLAALVGLALYLPVLMALWFAPALVVLKNASAMQAMKASLKGCLLNVLPFLTYGVLGMLLMIMATLPFLLGWLVLLPVIIASVYVSYREIFVYPVEEARGST